jgi:hypothetical protein
MTFQQFNQTKAPFGHLLYQPRFKLSPTYFYKQCIRTFFKLNLNTFEVPLLYSQVLKNCGLLPLPKAKVPSLILTLLKQQRNAFINTYYDSKIWPINV